MRKLATGALGFAIAVFTSRYIIPHNILLIAGIISLAVSLVGLFFRGNVRLRFFIIFISAAIGFICSFAYTAVFVAPYWELHEQSVSAEAVVSDYPVAREPRGYRVDVSLKPKDGGKKVGARLYYYSNTDLKPGDFIEFTAKFYRTDITDDGERYDTMTSKGIFLSGSVSGDIVLKGSDDGFRYIPKRITQSIASMIDEIFPHEIAPFLKALLVGRREDLNKNQGMTAALTASGIIHVVAISGMHISFLMGFLSQVIKNRFLFAVYGIPVLILFMAMTGFTPAVTRAGIMQIFLICAPLLRRESDSITSLSAAMLLLIMLNPYACASVGLQMSFAATLGIILFTPGINLAVSDFLRNESPSRKKSRNRIIGKKIPKAITNYISSSLSATIGALILTLPLGAIHFGYISLISPITNLLTIGIVSVTFPAGLIATIAGFVHPGAAGVIAVAVNAAVEYILFVARMFASIPYGVVYSSSAHIMFWLAYVYVMFILATAFKARMRQYIYPVCLSVIMLFTVVLVSVLLPGTAGDDSVTAVDVGQGSCTVVSIEGRSVVVDCGSLSKYNAGEIAHEFLQGRGITSIDILALTHFHDDHVNGVEFLLSRTKVSALVIPDPEGSFLAEDIIELARKQGTDIIYVSEAIKFDIGQTQIFVYPPLGSGDENERGLSFLFMGELTTLITGDMNATIERALLRYADLPELDILIAGHHGSRESTSEELLSALSPKTAIISVGKNSFGHPHPDVLERLERHRVTVYRTDEMGHVTVGSK